MGPKSDFRKRILSCFPKRHSSHAETKQKLFNEKDRASVRQSESLWKEALLPCAPLPDPLHSHYSCNHMWPSSLAQTPINSWSPLTLTPRGSCYCHPVSLMEPKAGGLPTAPAPQGQEGPSRENVSLAGTRVGLRHRHKTSRTQPRGWTGG